ncbi:hypothetical protein O6H91_16G059800 [Diphasiastrum complanatum]|uniref:Uncharacterized protein n=1 Tax=Diphasiastrum complanatum TaxID=34168 RepID=A0ACC2BCM8_DIPCM|nr:hypothetical protein O6H91_16G059800 [Diphasiastrum complanatum]
MKNLHHSSSILMHTLSKLIQISIINREKNYISIIQNFLFSGNSHRHHFYPIQTKIATENCISNQQIVVSAIHRKYMHRIRQLCRVTYWFYFWHRLESRLSISLTLEICTRGPSWIMLCILYIIDPSVMLVLLVPSQNKKMYLSCLCEAQFIWSSIDIDNCTNLKVS